MSISYTYSYERLEDPSQQIRLLKVNGARDNGSVLTGSLSVYKVPPRNASRTARLSKHLGLPFYFAMSYVWGTGPDLQPSHEIIIDGRRFPITANVHAALHTRRSANPTSMRYWIDAICINQEDDYEKSAQVALMRDIYHLAGAVLVWLGGEQSPEATRVQMFFSKLTDDSWARSVEDLALKLADIETESRNIGQRKRPLAKAFRTESERLLLKGATKGAAGLLRGVQIGFDIMQNSLSDHLDDQNVQGEGSNWVSLDEIMSWSPNENQLKLVQGEDFQEIAALLDKILFSETQYFSRMWTLQEICVANCGLVKVLGTTLDSFLSAFYYMQRTYNISAPNIEKITTLLQINEDFNSGRRQPLRTLLALSAGRKSEDPRDRIYALQGLMKDEVTHLLKPDYAKSVAEVYANASRHIIYKEKSLDVICGHQLQDRLLELPSWVPDFRHFGLEPGALVQPTGEYTVYSASLSEQHSLQENPFQLPQDWATLTVTGIFVDTVATLSDILAPNEELQTERFARIESLWAATLIESQEWKPEELEAIHRISDLVRRYAEFYHNSNRATFWARNPDKLQKLRTITGNISNESASVLNLQFRYLLTLLCGRIMPKVHCKTEEELVEHTTRLCIEDETGIKKLEGLCKALDAGTRGRRLLISEGKQIGAGPEETQKDDMIYILMGCSVPVILRKTMKPDEFQFVGECYWHGFMDGESLAMRDGDKLTAHEFKLV